MHVVYRDSEDLCSFIDGDGKRANANLARSLVDMFNGHPNPGRWSVGRARGTLGPTSGSVESSLAHTDEICIRKNKTEALPRTAENANPHVQCDLVHEEDGGDDSFGSRPQNGQGLFAEELLSLRVNNGEAEAWDDVTHNYLDSTRAAAARTT